MLKSMITKIKLKESKRLGFPSSGGVLRGRFTADGWEPSQTGEPILDLTSLGILDHKPASTYLNNVGSPFESNPTAHNSKKIESLLIEKLAYFFKELPSKLFGYVTTGGTEGNLAALWWHREYLTKHNVDIKKINQIEYLANQQNKPPIPPLLICSDQSHYSIFKSTNILGYSVQIATSFKTTGINISKLKEILVKNLHQGQKLITIIVNVGTTKEGCIDDLVAIKYLCEQLLSMGLKYTIHADAAIYGVLLPVIEKLKNLRIFDFVDTLSISGHKFLGSFSVCGVVLTKKDLITTAFANNKINIPYIGNIKDVAISGSRSGFAAIELYTILEVLDAFKDPKDKLKKIYQQCEINASYFYCKLKNIVRDHQIFKNYLTIGFPKPLNPLKAKHLERKYSLMSVSANQFVAKIFPQVTMSLIHEFINEYQGELHEYNI